MVLPSLWAQYIAELRDTVFIEHEYGFISYSLMAECIYLEDVFVLPERRREGLALKLVEEAEAFGIAAGKPYSMAVIRLENKGHAESLKAHLNVGFVPFLTEGGKIWLKRNIGEGAQHGGR